MNVQINIAEDEVGDPRIGYHDYRMTVSFVYPDERGPRYIPEREEEIVNSLVKGSYMWKTITKDTIVPNVWRVSYGYDSGD